METIDIPSGYKSTTPNDPYPVSIFGESKSIPDNKLGNYLTDEFFYYNSIYENNKKWGLPYKWIEAPYWVIELHNLFDQLEIEYNNYLMTRNN